MPNKSVITVIHLAEEKVIKQQISSPVYAT